MRIRVVLVRPRNPNNIGACARAMANFGFSDLVVVDPYEPIWQETRAAPDAEDVVLKAKKVQTLTQAVKGFPLVLGTSSFAHRKLEQAIIKLPVLKGWLQRWKTGRIALVFGSERSGLSNEELCLCRSVIQIDTKGSMNLAQAVAVTLYELTRVVRPAPSGKKEASPEEMIQAWIALGESVNYPAGYTKTARAGRFRKALQPLPLSEETAHFLKSFARWLLKKRKA